MDISIVIPLLNEEESLPELCEWIARVMDKEGFSYEVLLIDDGSTDGSWSVIEAQNQANPCVKGIRFQRNYGKSAALNVGFEAALGKTIFTMDADLQDSPDELPVLYRRLHEEGLDLISGWKKKRYDPLSKTIPTKLFNWATRKVSGVNNLHDFNCGLKVYRAEVVKSIEVYGEMHRYIPVIANWAGFKKIEEQVVEHRARKYGHTKFGLERFVNGFLDLLSIYFVSRFGKKPMHFFGLLGSLSFFSGGVITVVVIFDKLFKIANELPHRDITSQPLFFLALVLVIVGVQLFVTGFLAELVSRSSADRNRYLIKQRTGLE
ncbi:MAG: glycosyltransferase family 2 protein [Sphingobacteriaceae bacterium]|nr:glycosyltransferase family 2 protein [Sphingobacteriaceae bacterium]